MAILKHILPLLLIPVLTGCYEEFDPDVHTTPVLCMNSLISAGEPIEIGLSHSWMYNNTYSQNNHDVTDAVISIIVNGNSAGRDYIPQEGDKIFIIAESRTYGTATAEVTVPRATPIGDVKLTEMLIASWIGDKDFYHYDMLADLTFNILIEMDIVDPVKSVDYYKLDFKGNNTPGDESKFTIGRFDAQLEPLFKEHIGVFESVMVGDNSSDFLFFSDRQFDGKTYTLHFDFINNYFNVKSQDYDESLLDCSITLYLSTISKSYYNWAVYKWNIDEGIMGDFADVGFAESKWGYSNVSTGAGVVAAKSTVQYTINLKDFLKQALQMGD